MDVSTTADTHETQELVQLDGVGHDPHTYTWTQRVSALRWGTA